MLMSHGIPAFFSCTTQLSNYRYHVRSQLTARSMNDYKSRRRDYVSIYEHNIIQPYSANSIKAVNATLLYFLLPGTPRDNVIG